MTPLPGAVQSTGLILATVLAAAGLNLGVMSLGQPDGDGTDVDTAATATSATLTSNGGDLQALSDTAPAAADPGTATTVLVTDPAATDPAAVGSTPPAGTGITPGPPVAAGTSSTGAASSTAAPAPATASTAGATTAATQPTTVTTRPPSTQAPVTPPPATVTTARPASTAAAPTTATTARPTTRAPQTSSYSHDVTGAGSLTVSVTDGRLAFVSATDASGWTHTVDTNRADLIKVVFTRRGNEIAVSVTLRNGAPNFTEERSNDD